MTGKLPHEEHDRFLEACHAVKALNHGGDDALRRVAALLREDHPAPALLKMLSTMLDPDAEGWLGARLIVKRTRRGAPKGDADPDLEHFIDLHCFLLPGEKVEAVAAAAAERFGCSRSTFFKMRADREAFWTEERIDLHRTTARLMREAGAHDYQPL